MRLAVDRDRVEEVLRALGRAADRPGCIYLTGGATAVLHGWRTSTVDIDLWLVPEEDSLYRELSRLKDRLRVNLEIASPAHFIPEVPGWQERSVFIERHGGIDFFHYDPYSQALSKLERGHQKDLEDVRAMVRLGMVEPDELFELFERIEPALFRYPAIDPVAFRGAVERFIRSCRSDEDPPSSLP